MSAAGAGGEVPIARLMAMAFRSIIDELHRRLAERGFHDVRPAFGFALLAARDGTATAQDITRLMGTSKQAAAKLLESMEERDLVRRTGDPDDRRARRISLTPRGEEVLATVESIYRDIEEEWASILGRRKLESLRADLVQVMEATHGGRLPALRPLW